MNLVGEILYRAVALLLAVSITTTSSIPLIRHLPHATSAYLGMLQQLGLLIPDSTSPTGVRPVVPQGMPEEIANLLPSIGADGELVGFLLNADAFQASKEDFAPASVANPISVSRVQSAYTAGAIRFQTRSSLPSP